MSGNGSVPSFNLNRRSTRRADERDTEPGLPEGSGDEAWVHGETTPRRDNVSVLTKSKCPECRVNGCLYWLGPPAGVVHWFCPDCGVEGMTSTYEQKRAAMGGNTAGGHGVETVNSMYDARGGGSSEDHQVEAMAYTYEEWRAAEEESAPEEYGVETMTYPHEQGRALGGGSAPEPTKGFCPHCKGREAIYWVGSEGALHWFCPECESG